MRIAILIHPFGRFGGAERLAILHAIELAQSGYEIVLYTDKSLMDPVWLRMLLSRVQIRDLPYCIWGSNVLRELGGFDRILIHHHIEPLLALRVVRKYSEKTYWYTGEVLRAIWEEQITGEDYRQFSPTVFGTAEHFYGRLSWVPLWGPLYNLTVAILRQLDVATVRRYKGIIANSHYMGELVQRLYHYPGPLFVAYPAPSIPSSMFKPNYGGGEYVLTVAALLPNKNHRILLEAMSLLDDPPELRIVGDGQERERLRSQARKLGLDARFDSKVSGEALCRLYEQSLFVVVPSLSEPFGMTALEGALAGKPSVVTEQGGAKEFVLDQETGLVVPPRSSKDMASALSLLINDEGLRRRMGQRARERALDSFTSESSALALRRALNP